MVVRGDICAEVFINLLKRSIHGRRRPIFLIVDGYPSHRRKQVKAYVEFLQRKLRLFFLPLHSLELNPDELAWNDVKNNSIGRTLVHSPADMMRAIVGRQRYLQGTSKNPPCCVSDKVVGVIMGHEHSIWLL